MHAATAHSRFRRVILPLFFIALLMVCVITLPSLSLPLALLMPLMVCPARISTGLWFSLSMTLIPGLGLLSTNANPLLALCALSFSCLSLLVSFAAQKRKLDLNAAALWYSVSMLISLALLCWQISYQLGGDLFHSLAAYLTDAIASAPKGNAYLYAMAQMGLVPFSSPAEEVAAALLGEHVFLVASVKAESLLALRFQLYDLLRQRLPLLLVQLSLTVGLFTALHTVREDLRHNPRPVLVISGDGKGEIKTSVSVLPSFRGYSLPTAHRFCLLVLSLFSLMLFCYGRGEITWLVSVMTLAAVTTTYSLLGASVWVLLLCHGRPRRTAFAGFSAGALFLLFPGALFVLGLCDQFLHIRAATLNHEDHEEV